ncbi:hypothetical protein [Acinetobacter sp.]|uniref:hypothetical protein n=1 Tax=Acinetobacter sp. TaxID=472 RepID=UPI002FCB2379
MKESSASKHTVLNMQQCRAPPIPKQNAAKKQPLSSLQKRAILFLKGLAVCASAKKKNRK